jgi:hypothetical protein
MAENGTDWRTRQDRHLLIERIRQMAPPVIAIFRRSFLLAEKARGIGCIPGLRRN